MPNLQNQLRWYSKRFTITDFKKKNPVRLDSVVYLFAIIDSKKNAEDTAKRIKTALEENSRDIIDLPESINKIPYRMLWIRSPLVLEQGDNIGGFYSGITNRDPQMYSAFKKNGMNGLRNYIYTEILGVPLVVKKKTLARFLMF